MDEKQLMNKRKNSIIAQLAAAFSPRRSVDRKWMLHYPYLWIAIRKITSRIVSTAIMTK